MLAGPSVDQLYAQRFGQDTPIPSLQLCIENVDQSGGCAYGYACVYTDTISWAAANEPLPMIRDPRVAFDQLFGVGRTAEERAAHRQTDRSILDWITDEVSRLKKELGATDRARLNDYLDDVREIERRIQRVEMRNATEPRELPEAPVGVPDSFEEHVKLMFDLQALAFMSDMTRVFSFKMGRDASGRVYPESGTTRAFHAASHHGGGEERVLDFAKINTYHVGMVPYFLEKLKEYAGGRRQSAREEPHPLRVPDGRLEPAQPQTVSAVPGGARQRTVGRQPPRQGAGRDVDGERHVDAVAPAGPRRSRAGR